MIQRAVTDESQDGTSGTSMTEAACCSYSKKLKSRHFSGKTKLLSISVHWSCEV